MSEPRLRTFMGELVCLSEDPLTGKTEIGRAPEGQRSVIEPGEYWVLPPNDGITRVYTLEGAEDITIKVRDPWSTQQRRWHPWSVELWWRALRGRCLPSVRR